MLKFTKMHGIGNCYIYINCFEEEVFNPNKLSEFVSDFHFGIGSDGLVLIMPSEVADFRMRMFNADGSEAEMCGNAVRCVAKYVYENGMTNKLKFTLETLGGIKTLDLDVVNGVVEYVSVDMGEAILKPEAIPINLPGEEIVDREIEVDGKKYNITGVSMGNPHAVVFVDDVDSLNLAEIGPKFENHELFPERINTEFVQIIDNNTVKMRVWERGSGETWACGTGACASAAAAVKNGFCRYNTPISVLLDGGLLKVQLSDNYAVTMTGPAETVYEGDIAL